MTRYTDHEQRVYEARKGLGDSFMTMRDGHRVKSINLPVRETLAEAQSDLDWWAKRRHLRPLDDDDVAACRICGCTENSPCPGGCWWVPDPEMLGDLCSACLPQIENKAKEDV
jgi:hypothetical protein